MNKSPSKVSPLLFLLVTAFLFATGISLVFPVLPFIVAKYVTQVSSQAAMIGLLGASYAFCSFFSSPVLGALSDVYGRRPVILLSLAGSATGYLIFGIGGGLWVLFLGRIIDGLCAGGMGALFGYLADTTPEEQRGKMFGQIGATVGAGFIVGPAIGGLASHLSLSAPMFLAAVVATLNMLWGALMLPESRSVQHRSMPFDFAQLNPFKQLSGTLASPSLRRLVTVSVLFGLVFSLMGLMALLTRDTLGWGPGQVSTVYIVVGFSDIVAQGLVLPFLLRAFKERGVAILGLSLGVVGMVGLALLTQFPLTALLYFSVLAFAIGEGIFNASQSALISVAAPAEAQGQVQGGVQAFGSLAQVVGPLGGGQLYSRLGPGATYGTAAALALVALGLLLRQKPLASETEADGNLSNLA